MTEPVVLAWLGEAVIVQSHYKRRVEAGLSKHEPHCIIEVDLVDILIPESTHQFAGDAGPQISVCCLGALSPCLCDVIAPRAVLRGSGSWRVRDGIARRIMLRRNNSALSLRSPCGGACETARVAPARIPLRRHQRIELGEKEFVG